MKKFKQRVYEILWVMDKNDRVSQVINTMIILLIITNVIGIIMSSFDNFYQEHLMGFLIGGVISTLVFTMEYILRLWTSDLKYKEVTSSRLKAGKNYILSGSGIIDLVSILPSYLPMFVPIDLKFLRILRLGKILRVFKLEKFTEAIALIKRVMNKKKEVLLSTLYIIGMMIIISSILMYYAEHDAQPEAFPNIVATFWWAIVTLTTIGYGDVYPITIMGKILASIIAIIGIGIVALPTGILSSGFMEEIGTKSKVNQESLKNNHKKEREEDFQKDVSAQDNIPSQHKDIDEKSYEFTCENCGHKHKIVHQGKGQELTSEKK